LKATILIETGLNWVIAQFNSIIAPSPRKSPAKCLDQELHRLLLCSHWCRGVSFAFL